MADTKSTLPILDKLSLNNEIILLRCIVKKAKNHVVRKIIREIKLRKQEKSWHTDAIKLKNQAKVERLTEQLHVVKTLNNDEISKMALLNETKEFMEVIRDPAVNTKEKLIAKIACQKVFVTSVAKVLSKYLPVTNAHLTTLVENLGVKRKKSKNHLVAPATPKGGKNQTSEDSDEQEISASEASFNELEAEEVIASEDNAELGIPKTKKKKHKHIAAEDAAAPSDELEMADELENDENKNISRISTKNRHKSRHIVIEASEVSSGELEVTETLDCENIAANGVPKTKKRKVAKDAAAPSSELETAEVENEEQQISTEKQQKSRQPIVKDIQATSEKSSRRKNFKLNQSSVTAERIVKGSTKAIRFSELLKLEAESLQSDTVEKHTGGIKAVDPFFVSMDGKSKFMTNVISDTPEDVQETKNKKYDEMRQQYLNDYGYLPNRAELRKQERQGVGTFKSFHNLSAATLPTQTDDVSEHQPARAKRPFPVKPRFEDVPVHPSWEAKRKEKEMLSVSFQGKKIKFD